MSCRISFLNNRQADLSGFERKEKGKKKKKKKKRKKKEREKKITCGERTNVRCSNPSKMKMKMSRSTMSERAMAASQVIYVCSTLLYSRVLYITHMHAQHGDIWILAF